MLTRLDLRDYRCWVHVGFAALILAALPTLAASQQIRDRNDVSRLVALEKISVSDDSVSGEVVNRAPHAVRDVQLFIRYTWLWDNEFKPGKDDPGRSTYYTLPQEIPPGGRSSFTYKAAPPLAKADGGRFITTIEIAGLTEIIPQSR